MKWFWFVMAILWAIVSIGRMASGEGNEYQSIMALLCFGLSYLTDIKEAA